METAVDRLGRDIGRLIAQRLRNSRRIGRIAKTPDSNDECPLRLDWSGSMRILFEGDRPISGRARRSNRSFDGLFWRCRRLSVLLDGGINRADLFPFMNLRCGYAQQQKKQATADTEPCASLEQRRRALPSPLNRGSQLAEIDQTFVTYAPRLRRGAAGSRCRPAPQNRYWEFSSKKNSYIKQSRQSADRIHKNSEAVKNGQRPVPYLSAHT